jgi:D-threo-aldose 1-dehydrogenase
MGQAHALVRYAQRGDFDCFLLAGEYTLLEQPALSELLPLCLEQNIAVVMGSVFHGGLLAGPQPGQAFAGVSSATRERIERMQEVCDRFGVPLKAAALQFPLGHPAVVSVLSGVRSVAELEENVRAFQHPLPFELWQELQREGLIPEEAPLPQE